MNTMIKWVAFFVDKHSHRYSVATAPKKRVEAQPLARGIRQAASRRRPPIPRREMCLAILGGNCVPLKKPLIALGSFLSEWENWKWGLLLPRVSQYVETERTCCTPQRFTEAASSGVLMSTHCVVQSE
ncbi:hypothetical protein J6590_054358 [Homalodisca vitripennis]|nr:hypothetical protein J6590_054358 [Homalodisca vitripennis]